MKYFTKSFFILPTRNKSLKYDIIENSRIELRGIVVPVQVVGLLGGPKGMLAPLSNYWGGGGAGPPWPPSSYAYEFCYKMS